MIILVFKIASNISQFNSLSTKCPLNYVNETSEK
jgi:hypothetical protein